MKGNRIFTVAALLAAMLVSTMCDPVEPTPEPVNGNKKDTIPTTPVTPDQPTPPKPSDYYADFKIPSCEEPKGARAFPGAEGGGMYTTGGRGGKVIHVTNLNDSGPGSLRAALSESGTRTVVFDVAGVIALDSPLKIDKGDLTIAGQTAPGGGICIKNYTTNLQADNIIIRFIHFRLGDEGPNAGDSDDAIWGRYHKNIIIDHCSMSWSIDECASFYANCNFTLQWCILTESMNDSAHSKGAHGYGGIWGGKDASFHHNLLANHHSRNPRIDHPGIYGNYISTHRGNVDLRNNVIYNWGDNNCYGGEGGWFNLVNCYYRKGPSSTDRKWFIDAYGIYNGTSYGYPQLYMAGNIFDGNQGLTDDNHSGVYWHHGASPANHESFLTAPLKIAGPSSEDAYVTTHTAQSALNQVLAYAGASLVRDDVDKRAVDGVKNNTGKIINTQAEVGGWPQYVATDEQKAMVTDTDGDGMPDWFETKFGLDGSSASDGPAKTIDTLGRYTNLEMYLHYLVRDLTTSQIKSGSYDKL